MPAQHGNTLEQCPLCGGAAPEPFLRLPDLPVLCNVLWDSREEARRCARGPIELVLCPDCSLIYNRTFDASRLNYTTRYDNCLHHSRRFVEYAEALALELVRRYNLENARIVEVGSGKGDFLRLLCRTGGNSGIGFDPSYEGPEAAPGDTVRILREYYHEEHASHGGDLLVCRQVLEHILEPVPFLERIARGLGRPGVPVFFEVPNGDYTLRNTFVWDVIYEHPVYYCAASIESAFKRAGFELREVTEEFEGQYLGVHATTGGDGEAPDAAPAAHASPPDVAGFAARVATALERWNRELEDARRDGVRTVIWGAGSKGITFLNLLPDSDAVGCAVDVSPAKQGRYVSGTGHEIVAPDRLTEYRPGVVFLMNPVYEDEVHSTLQALGVEARLVCL